jgi:predicted alpha/beta superfamily hydrolase
MNSKYPYYIMQSIKKIVLLVCCLLLAGLMRAQDSLYSSVLHQERRLEIFLPQGGLKPGARYDVFYVLDGEWNMTITREITDFLVNEGMIPPQIMVSVLNGEPNLRDRDFTPTHVADNPTSGRADDFISFLKNELQPYIAQKYPVSGYNTLFGHSFGGLFGMYALLKSPGLFSSYILADPSFWWDNHFLYPLTSASVKQPGRAASSLFILGRKGDGSGPMDAAGMDSVLATNPNGSLQWRVISSPEETHNSTKLRALVEGLRFVYKGYIGSPVLVNPTSGGFVLKDQPFTLYCYNGFTDPVHYSTDGDLPSENSKPLHGENRIALTRSSDITVRSITTRPELEQTIREHFEVGAVIKAEGKPDGNWLPSKTFNINQLQTDPEGWKKMNAWLEIKEAGYYNLQIMGAAGVRWSLANKLVMSSDTAAFNGHFQSVIVPLEKGYYPMRIEIKPKNKVEDVVLLYNTPSSGGNGVGLLTDLLYLSANK